MTGAVQIPCPCILPGIPSIACLSLLALILSDGLGAFLRVRCESGVGNVSCSFVDIFHSNGHFLKALVHASGKQEQITRSPVDHWSNGRACQEC
jgi:hypothetical protein